jgi:hypothetical protein
VCLSPPAASATLCRQVFPLLVLNGNGQKAYFDDLTYTARQE